MTAAVGLHGVTKRFGAVAALDGVSLEIEPGQFVTLLGPSGCGKTTLLRIVAGLERPTSGDILLDGRNVTATPAQKRGLGFAFQRYALFPHLTVLENVAFGLKVRRVGRSDRRARAREMLEMVGLGDLGDRMPTQISGGQAQRVALARALAPEPSVLLLDEPLTALDLAVRTQMQEELRRLHRGLGTTFVFVTHDQGEALTMSDRIVLLRDGEVVQDSSPFELFRRPRSLFAATFVGEANAWEGVAAAVGEGHCVVRLAGGQELAARPEGTPAAGERAAYVVRPQRVRLDAGGGCTLGGVVSDVIARGPRALVVVEAAGGVVVRAECDAAEAERFSPGVHVDLSWATDDAVVFGLGGATGA
jgi:ABC-type Fe3+/spermidine/putrescine transport system ATPase subunit